MNFSVDEETAKAVGMTHEGTAFGAPAWVSFDQYGGAEIVPKNKIYGVYMDIANWVVEVALYFFPETLTLECVKGFRKL